MEEQTLIININRTTKKILVSDIFYGLFIGTVEKKESDKIPLAAVSVNKSTMDFSMLFNKEKWFELSDRHKFYVLMHEAQHLTEFHLLTSDLYPNSELDNIATDLVINQRIGKENLPSWGIFIEDYEKKYPQLDWKRNAGRDHYYKELSKLPEEDKKKLGISEEASHTWIITDKDGKEIDPSSLTQSELNSIKTQVESTISSICEEIKKSQGNLPSEIEELINGFVKPKPVFNYLKYVRNIIGNSTKYEIKSTRFRENQRFSGRPKLTLKPKNRILVAVDESGSVSTTELYEFLNEIHHVSKKVDLEIRPFDTEVKNPVKYNGKGVFKRTECGGTKFTPVVEFYTKRPDFNLCIVFTDGRAEVPPICNKKMLWVVSSDGRTCSLQSHHCIKIPKNK